MSKTQDLENLKARRAAILSRADAPREGALNARERIAHLLDEGSFLEWGQFHAPDGLESEAAVTGSGTIDGRPVFVFAQDYSVLSGSMSGEGAKKISRMLDMALKVGAPVVGIYDSTGARLSEGVGAMDAYGALLRRQAELSGALPQIALVLGPCAGTAAFGPSLADLLIMGGQGELFMAGPQVVASRTDNAKPSDIGGGNAMMKGGAAHLYFADEKRAIQAAREALSFLPSNNEEDAPAAVASDLNRLNAFSGELTASELLAQIADAADSLVLQPDYAPAACTAFARVGGQSVGFVFAQGVLDEPACDKIARFVRMCDAFNLPVVTFADAQGFAVERHHAALLRAGARLLYAYAETTSPKISVVVGNAVGGAYLSLGSRSMGADVTYAWPSAVISAMDPEAAAQIVYAKDLAKAENPVAARGEFTEKYVVEYASAAVAEKKGAIDEVIDPADTRRLLINALYLLAGKRDARPARKHGNAPL